MKHLFSTLFLICTGLASIAQDITGSWQAMLPIGEKNIRLIFNVSKSGNEYSTTMDSPDQNGYGIKCSKTVVTYDSLIIGIDIIKGSFKGKLTGAAQIEGVYSQGQSSIQINLRRLHDEEIPKTPATKIKPQTPRPPFNYISEEVMYDNLLQQVTLGATLTKPKGEGKFSVVLMITGSGPQDRDETIGMHKPFLVIADYLTNHGIAVLRIDDRGVGKSSGDFRAATSADFATDVMAGINYLKTRKDIDTTKIGLIGHSEGGLIAPYVAALRKDVAFIVLLAGPAVGGKQTMYYQAVEKPLSKESEHDRNAYGQLYNKMLEIALNDEAGKDILTYVRNTYFDWKKQQPDSTLKALLHGSDEAVITSFSTGFSDLKRAWWQFFLTYDITKDLGKIKIPVLALYGEKDEQVDPKANLIAIRKILKQNGNQNFKVYEVPGVNHLFQHCKVCGSVEEYLALEETFDSSTLAMIGNWIKEQVK